MYSNKRMLFCFLNHFAFGKHIRHMSTTVLEQNFHDLWNPKTNMIAIVYEGLNLTFVFPKLYPWHLPFFCCCPCVAPMAESVN